MIFYPIVNEADDLSNSLDKLNRTEVALDNDDLESSAKDL